VEAPEVLTRVGVALAGIAVVLLAVRSAIRTFVLPRPARDGLLAFVFVNVRKVFNLVAGPTRPYAVRDRRLAWFAPVGLLLFPVVEVVVIIAGYTLIYWALGLDLEAALRESGSSMLTLGFSVAPDLATTLVAFSQAAIGLVMVALLIAYLPTMYADFTRRESEVNLLEVRAGTPASAVYMWELAHRIGAVDRLDGIFERWERWFSELEETHTTLPALTFFRSPRPSQSWVSASAAVLDAAALRASTLDRPRDPQVETCIRAGC
jgi:fumarate reductase subunit D